MLLTIYTPTYNRAELLQKLYNSLCQQTCSDFKWLVIDDGSTDNTKDVIENWKKENKINIEYAYKENGGVHTARDLAYELVDTELIVGIDSDDFLSTDFVEVIVEKWNEKDGSNYCGIITPVQDENGNLVGSKFPNVEKASFQELTYKFNCVGDHNIVLRSDIIKKIPKAPVFERERLVGENYKWIQLPDIPFLLVNKCIVNHFYLTDGYTKNARISWFKNLNGFRAEYKAELQYIKFFIPRQKFNIKYSIASLFLKDRTFVKNSPRPTATAVLFPISFVLYLFYSFKWRAYAIYLQ